MYKNLIQYIRAEANLGLVLYVVSLKLALGEITSVKMKNVYKLVFNISLWKKVSCKLILNIKREIKI